MLDLSPAFQVDVKHVAHEGKRFAVIGKSGSGKTFTLRRFAEQWLLAGYPLTIIDPLRQFAALRTAGFPVVLAGRKGADTDITPDNAAALATFSLKERVSLVLDLRLHDDDEEIAVLEAYLDALWGTVYRQEESQPYALFIDEAQTYAPEGMRTPLSKLLIKIAKMGRHMCLTTAYATQRPASIVKDVLTQANVLIAHRLSYGVDTAILQEQLPLPAKELNAMMRKLGKGEALIIGDADLVGDADYLRVQIAPPQSAADAPDRAPVVTALRPVDAALLKAMAAFRVEPQVDDIAKLRRKVQSLEQQLLERDFELAMLRQRATEQIEIKHIDIPVKMDAAALTMPSAFQQPALLPDMPYRSPLATTRGINAQRRVFESLVKDIGTLPVMHRRLLRYLTERGEEAFTVRELARYVGLSETTIKKHPPTALIQRGLLRRTLRGKEQHYASTVWDVVKARCPDWDTEQLVDELLKSLPKN